MRQKVRVRPTVRVSCCMRGAAMRAAKPKPMMARPVAKPRWWGKYFTKVDTGVM